ncbi:MAG: hypothetical protein Q7R41_20330, partial [Phycisphaerales bacterium]|nr:hypothetical protein [Phycisphaerales bacterium]
KVTALLKGVNCGDMIDNEFVFAERPGTGQFGFDYIMVARGAPGSGEANSVGLVAILKEAASTFGGSVNQSKLHDIDVWELMHEGLRSIGMSVAIFRTDDTIGLVTSRRSLEDVLGLLTGKSDAKPIIATPRFQEALASVSSPEDVVSFFDIKALLGAIEKMCSNMAGRKGAFCADGKPAGETTANADEKPKELAVIKKIIDQVGVFDYTVATVATRGHRELRSEAVRIQSGKEKSPLAAAILNRKPFDKFDRFIPAEATGFKLTGLIDFGLLYDAVIDFITKEVPDGPGVIAQWNGRLATIGFDPKTSLFDWWSGEMISVEMPPAVVTPMGGSDSVLMIRVKDSALAKTKFDAFVNFVKSKLQAEGQTLLITPAKVNAEGFQEITHPAVAMFLKPVIGVHGDWLMVGTSSAALNKCLDVDAGKAPSIATNARFSEEGLVPSGPVQSASFKDTSKFGQELGAAVGMAGMFGGMAVAGMPEKGDDERQAKRIVQSLLGMVMKLGPVLQKIDFYSSESSIATYDGKLTIRTESVVTYKKPKDSDAKAAGAPPAPPKAPTPPTPPVPPAPPQPKQ